MFHQGSEESFACRVFIGRGDRSKLRLAVVVARASTDELPIPKRAKELRFRVFQAPACTKQLEQFWQMPSANTS